MDEILTDEISMDDPVLLGVSSPGSAVILPINEHAIC